MYDTHRQIPEVINLYVSKKLWIVVHVCIDLAYKPLIVFPCRSEEKGSAGLIEDYRPFTHGERGLGNREQIVP